MGYFLFQVLLDGLPGAITFIAWIIREFLPILFNRLRGILRKERFSRSFKQEVADSLNNEEAKILENTRFFWAIPISCFLLGLCLLPIGLWLPDPSPSGATYLILNSLAAALISFVPLAGAAIVAPRYRRTFVVVPVILALLFVAVIMWNSPSKHAAQSPATYGINNWLPNLFLFGGILSAYWLAHKLDTQQKRLLTH